MGGGRRRSIPYNYVDFAPRTTLGILADLAEGRNPRYLGCSCPLVEYNSLREKHSSQRSLVAISCWMGAERGVYVGDKSSVPKLLLISLNLRTLSAMKFVFGTWKKN